MTAEAIETFLEHFEGLRDPRIENANRRLDWLEQKAAWAGLCSIGVVESERHLGDQVTTERRYFIASIEADAELFARASYARSTLGSHRIR